MTSPPNPSPQRSLQKRWKSLRARGWRTLIKHGPQNQQGQHTCEYKKDWTALTRTRGSRGCVSWLHKCAPCLCLSLGSFPSVCFVLFWDISLFYLIYFILLLSLRRLFSYERQKAERIWMGVELGGPQRTRERGNHNRDILYEKKSIFNKREHNNYLHLMMRKESFCGCVLSTIIHTVLPAWVEPPVAADMSGISPEN